MNANSVWNEISPLLSRGRIITGLSMLLPSRCFIRLRRVLIKWAGAQIDAQVVFQDTPKLPQAKHLERLAIGQNCFINTECIIDLAERVTLGERVYIGSRVQLITASHDYQHSYQRCGALEASAISIGDGTWLGSGSIVLSGVRIGKGVVVAAVP